MRRSRKGAVSRSLSYVEPPRLNSRRRSRARALLKARSLRARAGAKYQYKVKINGADEDFETIVWNKYISNLKQSESFYKYDDTSDDATFKRQIDKIYKNNLENAKLNKFQSHYENSFGVEYNADIQEYVVNEKTKQDIINAYTKTYSANKEYYDLAKSVGGDKNSYYSAITNTSNRENFVYYGEGDEDLLTCLHILVKFSETQTSQIEALKNDPYIQENLDAALDVVKSQNKTLAQERDFNTGAVLENKSPIGVDELFNSLINDINNISTHYSSESYIEEVTKVFNKYVYTYNTDTGIMNAKFDYIVGTKTSSMVNSFTEVVRSLYNNGEANYNPVSVKAEYNTNVNLYFPKGVGYAGAVSAPFLEEASNYSGYHIVLFTGKLKNIPADKLTIDNVYENLGKAKTSVSYNQTLFEYFYDKIAKENFETFKTNLVSDKLTTEYISANFSDLY